MNGVEYVLRQVVYTAVAICIMYLLRYVTGNLSGGINPLKEILIFISISLIAASARYYHDKKGRKTRKQ